MINASPKLSDKCDLEPHHHSTSSESGDFIDLQVPQIVQHRVFHHPEKGRFDLPRVTEQPKKRKLKDILGEDEDLIKPPITKIKRIKFADTVGIMIFARSTPSDRRKPLRPINTQRLINYRERRDCLKCHTVSKLCDKSKERLAESLERVKASNKMKRRVAVSVRVRQF